MATNPIPPNPRAPMVKERSTRSSARRSIIFGSSTRSRSSHPAAFISHRSADLAGRPVRLSPEIPVAFDAPLAAHHKLIGRWAVANGATFDRCTRMGARREIEQTFGEAVLAILSPFTLAELRVEVLIGGGELPPAIAILCDTIGQIELNWIEKSNALRDTVFGNVAPERWRAAAYRALVEALPAVLPIFDYDYLFEEIAAYYWDGELDDEGARRVLVEDHGHSSADVEEMTLPSAMNARRPAWMLPETAAPLKDMPRPLADRIRRLRTARGAMKRLDPDRHGAAWRSFTVDVHDYIPSFEDASTLPPMTLVPAEEFGRELDDVAQHGMQSSFENIAGFTLLPDPGRIDAWFASLRLGAELLLAAQDLILIDPSREASR